MNDNTDNESKMKPVHITIVVNIKVDQLTDAAISTNRIRGLLAA
jgi:hypothetical protein